MKRQDIEESKLNSQNEELESYSENEHLKQDLEDFQDMKLGVIVHWGLYSEAGIIESWQLSEEDKWAREKPWREDLSELRRDYWDLAKKFNPQKFNPDDWATTFKDAGFKYFIMTTKHHDGFNLFDTQESDYKITGEISPFHTNKNANVLKAIFEACRLKGLEVGAYYSKADWHSPYYWVPGEHAIGRNASYRPADNSKKWAQFVKFVHNQIHEIMTGYGKINLLWLDAGWVSPQTGEDLDMDGIVEDSRKYQPDLIVVDRTVGGKHENYVTPEQQIPSLSEIPKKPWESNLTLSDNWGYVPNDTYKSTDEIITSLIKVVSRGGNLLLGVGPKPDGTIPEQSKKIMSELGEWLDKNGDGIYGTRSLGLDFEKFGWWFVKKGNRIFGFNTEKELAEPLDISSLPYRIAEITYCQKNRTESNPTKIELESTDFDEFNVAKVILSFD